MVASSSGSKLSEQPGAVGMLSKMSGRYVAFYAEELAAKMLEDFLAETVQDLQRIEEKQKQRVSAEDAEEMARQMLDVLAEYQGEGEALETKWGNLVLNRPALKQSQQPKPIAIDLNNDLCELSVTQEDWRPGSTPPFAAP